MSGPVVYFLVLALFNSAVILPAPYESLAACDAAGTAAVKNSKGAGWFGWTCVPHP